MFRSGPAWAGRGSVVCEGAVAGGIIPAGSPRRASHTVSPSPASNNSPTTTNQGQHLLPRFVGGGSPAMTTVPNKPPRDDACGMMRDESNPKLAYIHHS